VWAVQIGVSYTFSPFVAETQVEVRETSRAQGLVEGCVKSEGAAVQDAVIEYAGMSGPRILVDEKGCFKSPMVDVGDLTIRVTHPDYQAKSETVTIEKNETTKLDIDLVPSPRIGQFKGTVIDEDDQSVDAVVEISQGGKIKKSTKTNGGAFDIQLPPGKYQVVVKSDGFLQQGTALVVEPLGKTTHNFMLKRPSKTRITKVTSEKIEISSKIPFELGKARLLKAAEFVLDDVVDVILSNPQLGKIRVEGHTDTTGEEQANMQLSDQRAAAVVEYLVAHGVPASRLEAKGYGYSRPVAPNDTEEGRAKNRRVEFVISGESTP
jgi:outer membrane protein OmpA-like peptidoglycan-associated protein